jgi:hypothetical protein
LITDLYRLVDVLSVDIDFREQEAGVTDLARPEYPALARTMRARRDNLLETISALRQRAGRSDVAMRPQRQSGTWPFVIFQTSKQHRFAARHVLFSPLAWPTGVHTRYRNRSAHIDDGTWILNNTAS